METSKEKLNIKELLSPDITKNLSKFLDILEQIDGSVPTKDTALILKKAMGLYTDPVLSFLLKKSFRLAVFKIKGTKIKNSIEGLLKLLHSPNRLDDLALAISTIGKTEAFLAIDYLKEANWKEFPQEILPCFCMFFKNNGNSRDCEDLLELTRHPNPVVIAAAIEAIKKLDTGSLRSVIAPLLQTNSNEAKDAEAIEQLYVTNVNHDSSNIANESFDYFKENHQLLIESLKNGNSEREILRILRLFKKYATSEDAKEIRPFLLKDKPNIVRAAIKVLERIDQEYLCIYLPQLLQDKNPKIRITAIRAFQNIDRNSVIEMVQGLLTSPNPAQRGIGITTGMLADFTQIRSQFITAFSTESNDDLIEKLGLVIAANPDSELVNDVYYALLLKKTAISDTRLKFLNMIAEKVSISLNGNPSANQLIETAKKQAESKIKETPVQQDSPSNSQSLKYNKNNSANHKSNTLSKTATSKISNGNDPISNDSQSSFARFWSLLSTKGKTILIFVFLSVVFWGFAIALLLIRLFS